MAGDIVQYWVPSDCISLENIPGQKAKSFKPVFSNHIGNNNIGTAILKPVNAMFIIRILILFIG